MRCQNLIEKNGEVVQCSREHTYEIRDKSEHVFEYLCTQHAERLVFRDLLGPDMLAVYVKDGLNIKASK